MAIRRSRDAADRTYINERRSRMFPVGCATASAWASARQQHVEPPLSVKLYRACVLLYRVPRYLGSLVARQLYNNEFIVYSC